MRTVVSVSGRRFTLRHLATVVGALQLMLPAVMSHAQGSVFAAAGGSWQSGTIASGGWRCGDTGTMELPGNASTADCNGGPQFPGFSGGIGAFESVFLTSGAAKAFAGSIGASSSVSWVAHKYDNSFAATFPAMSAGGNSRARWDDVAHFLPVGPVSGLPTLQFLDITFRVHGNIAGVEGLNFQIPNFGTGWIGNTTGQVAFAGNTLGNSFFASQVVVLGQVPSFGPAMPQFQTLRVGITGLVSNPFSIFLSTQAVVSIFSGFSEEETFLGSMQSAFANTVTPVSYNLWDDQGMDVTGQYAISFDQGLAFANQSVVPEPGTIGLLGVGLFGIGIGGLRRRRRA